MRLILDLQFFVLLCPRNSLKYARGGDVKVENDHMDMMARGRLARIARDGIPRTRRLLGRPPKRWRRTQKNYSNDS